MDVSFETADLAALCNSERRMAKRWGSEMGRTVGRRLLDVAASTATTLDRIPTARVNANGTGETTVMFAEAIVVRGHIVSSAGSADHTTTDTDSFVIASVEVQEDRSR
jgi:hypothetical protein